MRRAIRVSEAIRAVIVILAVLAVLSVFPCRIWQRTVTETAGGVRMEVSEQVNDDLDVVQTIIAQYDRLESVDVYVSEVLAGRYLRVVVFDENTQVVFRRLVDLGTEQIPGVVRIPLGIEPEVGKAYRILFLGCHAAYTMGLQNIPEGSSPYFSTMFQRDVPDPTWHLDMAVHYRQPLDKRTSLLLIIGIIAAAVILERLVAFLARRKGDEERLVTVGQTVYAVLLPVLLCCEVVMIIFILTGRFDRRLTDQLFYLAGILLAGGMAALYLLPCMQSTAGVLESDAANRKTEERFLSITHVIEMFQCVCVAFAMQANCDYMNGLADIDHEIAARHELIWLGILLALFLVGRRTGEKKRLTLNLFGFGVILFFILFLVFRNGRSWAVMLTVLMAAAMLAYFLSPRRESWLPVLSAGLLLHFLVSIVYCLLHRYFVAFVSPRFAFVFHTVTVTAEYLAIMCGVSFVLLLAALARVPRGAGVVAVLRGIRTEAILFGTSCAYVLFTVSRTGILAVVIMMLLLLIVAARRMRVRSFLAAACAALLCFPAVFTLQRTIPVMVGQPVFMKVEDASEETRGAINWDNTHLISLERYGAVFLDKLLNIDTPPYDYPEDYKNFNADGSYLYPRIEEEIVRVEPSDAETAGGSATVSASVPESAGEPAEEEKEEKGPESVDIDRMANGRLQIWQAYLGDANLTGYETMEVEMPDGELMVHAHNAYLQVLHDHGMITGIVFILVILFAVIAAAVYGRKYGKNMKGRDGEPDSAGTGIEASTAYVPLALTAAFGAAALTEWNFHLGNMMTVAMLLSWAPLCFKPAGRRQKDRS